jgi:hypothetical protein
MKTIERKMCLGLMVLATISLFLPIEEGSKLALSFYFSPTQLIKFGEGFILLFVAGAQIINTFLSLLFHESGGFDFIWHAIITFQLTYSGNLQFRSF